MLGVIVSGRLVQTNFQQVGESQFLINIEDADNINHLVVFLTGTIPLPDSYAASVHFSWPDPTAPPNWQLLGYISNTKPSAIFKISTLKKLNEMESSNYNLFGNQQISHIAQIGVQIEPEANVLQQTTATASTKSYLTFGQKMLENFFNYVSSFAITQSNMEPNPQETYVPLSTLQKWYTNFERRLEQNPNFWKS
ncbi:protein OPI10 homolog [Ctenocephalides felis]|uniref:protein OPI10 homolog n=1 Tax=Ctenocephalides felis TaxID=7515 RepID=UPI000E6E59D0|nr:protein OPI10 homolog [Ctenocephalides felis]